MKTEPVKLPEYSLSDLYPHHKVLSSSQLLTYLKDPAEFYTTYHLGVPKTQSTAMAVGSIFSALHADRSYPYREALAQVGAPKRIGDLFEQVIKRFPVVPAEIPFLVKHKGWGFRVTLDGYVKQEYTIIENKTGATGWGQERVNLDMQITMQAWSHLKKHKVQPRRIILNYVDTRPRATTILQSFNTTRSMPALRNFEKLVELAIEGIEAGNWTDPILQV